MVPRGAIPGIGHGWLGLGSDPITPTRHGLPSSAAEEQSMSKITEQVAINNQIVQVKSFHRRPTPAVAGQVSGDEVEIVVMLRGRGERRDFETLLRSPRLTLAIPDSDTLDVTVATAGVSSSGSGEKDAHRFDVTFRESDACAARRATDGSAAPPPAPVSVTPRIVRYHDAAADDDGDAIDDGATSDLGGSSVVWATAMRQMSQDKTAAAVPPPIEHAFSPTELAGIESILVGLRLEALIAELDRANLVRRGAIDDGFLDLVNSRFIIEATPVIGEKAARAAAAAVLTG